MPISKTTFYVNCAWAQILARKSPRKSNFSRLHDYKALKKHANSRLNLLVLILDLYSSNTIRLSFLTNASFVVRFVLETARLSWQIMLSRVSVVLRRCHTIAVLWAIRVDVQKAAEGSSARHARIGGAVDGGGARFFCRHWTCSQNNYRITLSTDPLDEL